MLGCAPPADKRLGEPVNRNVLLLSVAQALLMSGNSLLVATSALVGQALASDAALATLPLALQFLATMATSIPASLLMQRIGRRAGFMLGASLGGAGALLAASAILDGSFARFCLATVLVGSFNGFGIYYRFAAAEAAAETARSRAISYVLAGGVVAAFVGPNLANWTRAWIPGELFAGSYLVLAGLYAVSMAILAGLRMPRPERGLAGSGRPLRRIAANPLFLVAVLGAMFGYGTMTLLMTATPLAMQGHAHPFATTAFVIQWHVFGMFAPSFFTGALIERVGVLRVMRAGALLMVACVAVNLSGTAAWQFWLALLLLGLGWNFLFIGATTLLTETYRPEERARTQAANDFLVFTTVSAAALSAGSLHYHFGWTAVNLGVLPGLALVLIATLLAGRHRARGAAALTAQE